MALDTCIASEQQLEYIKAEFRQIIDLITGLYEFDPNQNYLFENYILFDNQELFTTVRKEHYLTFNPIQLVFNKYFWLIRYNYELNQLSQKLDAIYSGLLKELKPTSFILKTQQIDSFINFATNFDKQEYYIFDYFHPCLTDQGEISIQSLELSSIAKLLEINSLNIDELDYLIDLNFDNEQADLITYRSKVDYNTLIKIDTYSYPEDQICPVDLLIKCPLKYKEEVDKLLVSWWTRCWRKLGPSVCIANVDKFEAESYYTKRKKVSK